jgi:hypothetical protein
VTAARRSRTPSRSVWVAAAVAAAIVVASVVGFALVRTSVDARQRSLLHSDADQAAALTSSVISNASTAVTLLATSTTTSGAAPDAFTAQAQAVHRPLSVALAKDFLGHYVVFAAVGRDFSRGLALNPTVVAAVAANVPSAPGVPKLVPAPPGSVIWSLGPPAVPAGNIVTGELDLATILHGFDRRAPSADLRVSLFAGPRAASSTLIATTGATNTVVGPSASTQLTVEGAPWTIQVTAGAPVFGAFAQDAPLLVLFLGLALVLVSVLVGVAAHYRRRADRTDAPTTPVSLSSMIPTPSTAPSEAADVAPSSPLAPPVTVLRVAPGRSNRNGSSALPKLVCTPPSSLLAEHAEWRADPLGLHEARRFFLDVPTSVVRDGADEGYDPVPAPTLRPVTVAGQQTTGNGARALPQDHVTGTDPEKACSAETSGNTNSGNTNSGNTVERTTMESGEDHHTARADRYEDEAVAAFLRRARHGPH